MNESLTEYAHRLGVELPDPETYSTKVTPKERERQWRGRSYKQREENARQTRYELFHNVTVDEILDRWCQAERTEAQEQRDEEKVDGPRDPIGLTMSGHVPELPNSNRESEDRLDREEKLALEAGMAPYLARRTERQRLVLWRRYGQLDAVPFREISKILGGSSQLAQRHHDQAILMLRKELSQAFGDGSTELKVRKPPGPSTAKPADVGKYTRLGSDGSRRHERAFGTGPYRVVRQRPVIDGPTILTSCVYDRIYVYGDWDKLDRMDLPASWLPKPRPVRTSHATDPPSQDRWAARTSVLKEWKPQRRNTAEQEKPLRDRTFGDFNAMVSWYHWQLQQHGVGTKAWRADRTVESTDGASAPIYRRV